MLHEACATPKKMLNVYDGSKRCHIILSMLMNYKYFHLQVFIQLLYLYTESTAGG
jgi:hypothetical protein